VETPVVAPWPAVEWPVVASRAAVSQAAVSRAAVSQAEDWPEAGWPEEGSRVAVSQAAVSRAEDSRAEDLREADWPAVEWPVVASRVAVSLAVASRVAVSLAVDWPEADWPAVVSLAEAWPEAASRVAVSLAVDWPEADWLVAVSLAEAWPEARQGSPVTRARDLRLWLEGDALVPHGVRRGLRGSIGSCRSALTLVDRRGLVLTLPSRIGSMPGARRRPPCALPIRTPRSALTSKAMSCGVAIGLFLSDPQRIARGFHNLQLGALERSPLRMHGDAASHRRGRYRGAGLHTTCRARNDGLVHALRRQRDDTR
jgi:hypothetical protein